MCADLFGYRVSEATLASARQSCYEQLEVFEQGLKERLLGCELIHCDESGLRVQGSLHWMHVVDNSLDTFYQVHPKRVKVGSPPCKPCCWLPIGMRARPPCGGGRCATIASSPKAMSRWPEDGGTVKRSARPPGPAQGHQPPGPLPRLSAGHSALLGKSSGFFHQ